ncbi:MAG TPA: glycoside hydrolase family 2 TIM barrel-domain containing protein, partial [Terriglobia bacterium]|nr:glycoside hydrolase family 2 TIM barrel-domain containing protein [Terriglobia bacterium]
TAFSDSIQVPGCWQAQGFGERAGILKNHYVGNAWYRRAVNVPADWKAKVVSLRFGGVSRRATVFVNGKRIGEHDGFSAPFEFDITRAVRFGVENMIAVLVANPGPAISESPDKQTPTEPAGMFNYIASWGGMHGGVELEAKAQTWIDGVQITTQFQSKIVKFKIGVQSQGTGNSFEANLGVVLSSGKEQRTYSQTADFQVQPGQRNSVEIEVPMAQAMADAGFWSPESPSLYTAELVLRCQNQECDRVEERFGMRELTTQGNVLLLNGKPLYLRGYGDDNIEVITGVPPASKEVYRKRLELAKSFGFNAVRFHSMTPMREFFEAADEVGIFVMAELPVAYTQYFLPHKAFLRNELTEILQAHRNHPSFLSLALGNEFNLSWLKSDKERKEFLATVAEFYSYAKQLDPSRLILSNDGYVMRPTDMASLFRDFPKDVPTVRHEFGSYYCSLPDISLLTKFTGVIIPTWLEAKKLWVESSGLSDRYSVYLRNSQRLQHLGRKYQIERARLNPDVTGYHHWLITDFPGGTGEGDSWEEGWFDYFWQPKGITPSEGKEINNPVLLMISSGVNDRTLWSGDRKSFDVIVSNYGHEPIQNGALKWKLMSGDRVQLESTVTGVNAPLGQVTRVASLEMGGTLSGNQKLELVLELVHGQSAFVNRWSFWTFPKGRLLRSSEMPVNSLVKWAGLSRLYPFIQHGTPAQPSGSLLIATSLNRESMQFLESGGRVLLLAERSSFERSGESTFFPASGGALGTLISDHPALKGFPNEGFCDLQFYNLLEGAQPYSLDSWPQEMVPIVGGIRTTTGFLSKTKNLSRIGYLFEAKFGKGKLLVSALRIRETFDEAYPETISTFDQLLRYAVGDAFAPRFEIVQDQLRRFMGE